MRILKSREQCYTADSAFLYPEGQTKSQEFSMDEGRKRALWICAAILAERRLSALEDGQSESCKAK